MMLQRYIEQETKNEEIWGLAWININIMDYA